MYLCWSGNSGCRGGWCAGGPSCGSSRWLRSWTRRRLWGRGVQSSLNRCTLSCFGHWGFGPLDSLLLRSYTVRINILRISSQKETVNISGKQKTKQVIIPGGQRTKWLRSGFWGGQSRTWDSHSILTGMGLGWSWTNSGFFTGLLRL